MRLTTLDKTACLLSQVSATRIDEYREKGQCCQNQADSLNEGSVTFRRRTGPPHLWHALFWCIAHLSGAFAANFPVRHPTPVDCAPLVNSPFTYALVAHRLVGPKLAPANALHFIVVRTVDPWKFHGCVHLRYTFVTRVHVVPRVTMTIVLIRPERRSREHANTSNDFTIGLHH